MNIRDMDLGEIQAEREQLQSKYSTLYDTAIKSPTFLAKHTSPSRSDIDTDLMLRELKNREEALESAQVSRKWYGEPTSGGEDFPEYERDRGLIFDMVDFLSRPLYGVAGVATHLTGKGTGNFYTDVNSSIKNRETFGPLLRKMGVAPKASMPVGLALDIFLDPVNIMLGGSAALARSAGGKVVKGAVKAGAKGAKAGAEASGLRMLSRISKLLPVGTVDKSARQIALKALKADDTALELARAASGQTEVVLQQIKNLKKTAKDIKGVQVNPEKAKIAEQLVKMGLQDTPELRQAMTELIEPKTIVGKLRMGKYNLEKAANKAAAKYDALANYDIFDVIDRAADRNSMMGEVRALIEKNPRLEKFFTTWFEYSPNSWMQSAALMDDAAALMAQQGLTIKQVYNPLTRRFESNLENILEVMRREVSITFPNPSTMTHAQMRAKIKELLASDRAFAQKMSGSIPNTTISRVALAEETEILNKAMKARREIRKVIGKDRKGAGGYGLEEYMNKVLKIGNVEIGQKIIDAYDIYQGLFVAAKISSLSPSSMMYAAVGNPTMALMYGLKIFHPDNFKRMREAISVVYGGGKGQGAKDTLDWFITDPTMAEFLLRRSDTFQDVFGLNLRKIMAGDITDDIITEVLPGLTKGASKEKTTAVVKNIMKTIDEKQTSKWIQMSRTKDWAEAGEGALKAGDRLRAPDSTFILDSMAQPGGAFARLKTNVKESLETSSGLKKAGAWLMQKALDRSKDFTKVDQTYKLKDFLRLTRDGITESELLRMTRNKFVTNARISSDDILDAGTAIYRGGERYFKIKPDKAMEIVSDIYMNYAAMPSFIKVMRGLPVIGHPFFAFCRSEDTEILTDKGFKNHEEIKVGDMAMSFNEKTRKLEWKKIKNVFRFYVNDEIIKIKSRSMDILCTKEHQIIIAEKERESLGEDLDGERIRGNSGWKISRKTAWELKQIRDPQNISVVCGAENGYDGSKEIVPDEIVELVGWFVTEGYYTNKKIIGGYSNFQIPQSNPDGVVSLFNLRERIFEKYDTKRSVQIRKKEKIRANYDHYVFHFDSKMLKEIQKFLPGKSLTIDFLNKLSKRQLKLLFDIMILAGGSIDKKTGRMSFNQNTGETLDSFQTLCLMLGFSSSALKKPTSDNCYQVDVDTILYRQLKRNKPIFEKYNGIVWCPEVEDNHNWVARRNGRIDITGNTYAMSAKTGKTLLSNPSAFNKVNFLIREIDQERGPLVREALANSEYYKWMRQEGMVYLGENVPFFKGHPIFLNLAQVIPFYTLDIFNPSDRGFEDVGIRGQLASRIALSPFLKKPEGQVLLDFLVLPAILQNDKPVNMWGGPLYPETATGIEKVGYAGRQLAEAVMPSLPSAAIAPLIPSKHMELWPSFHGRKVGYAARGKTILGVSGKESPMQRSFRAWASIFGLNLYPMDLTYISNEIKRRQDD